MTKLDDGTPITSHGQSGTYTSYETWYSLRNENGTFDMDIPENMKMNTHDDTAEISLAMTTTGMKFNEDGDAIGAMMKVVTILRNDPTCTTRGCRCTA